jgi:MraZ protein
VFVGTFEHSLDEKGRVVLPATFRHRLAEGAVLAKLDGCLGLWTPEEFETVASYLRDKIREGVVDQNALRTFSADAHDARPDSQGRIVIPQRLRDFAGLQRDVVINGRLERIEIWDVERWRGISDSGDESLARAVAGLGI